VNPDTIRSRAADLLDAWWRTRDADRAELLEGLVDELDELAALIDAQDWTAAAIAATWIAATADRLAATPAPADDDSRCRAACGPERSPMGQGCGHFVPFDDTPTRAGTGNRHRER
jgi:hypothetical protein